MHKYATIGAVIAVLLVFIGFIVWSLFRIFSRTYAPPEGVSRVEGTTMDVWETAPRDLTVAGLVWARDAAASSEGSGGYGDSGAALQACGFPDVFPDYRSDSKAWRPPVPNLRRKRGTEWLVLRFEETLTERILVVETFASGVLARIDDVTDESEAVILWEGDGGKADRARVLRFTLEVPRRIGAVRLVFNTAKSKLRPQIDAAALWPADRFRKND